MKIKVLLFAPDEICQVLYPIVSDDEVVIIGRVADENKVLDEISRANPDIILISSNNTNVLLRACQQIYLLRPRSVPVVLTDDQSPTMVHQIIQTGVHYILPLTLDNYTMVSQLKGIYANESSRIIALENTANSSWKSKVIMVFGTKGGVGKTTIATNLAVKLAQKKRKVVLLDFDLQFGDANVSLGIDLRDSVSELLQEQSSPNADTIRRFLTLHASGVNLLSAPSRPEFADNISSLQTDKIISAIRTHYDYVIIDSQSVFNDINLSCFDVASSILFVTGMDIASLRRSKKGLSIINSLVGPEKVKLIIGKEYPGKIKYTDVSRVLEFPVWSRLPYDLKVAVDALNQGKPVVLDSPNSKLTREFTNLANKIDGSDGIDEKDEKDEKVLLRGVSQNLKIFKKGKKSKENKTDK